MNPVRKLHQMYLRIRYDFPIWLNNRYSKPYVQIFKHRFFTHSDRAKRKAVVRMYEIAFGHGFDMDHPRTFTEKVQWLKLYGDLPLMTQLADKYRVREYVREKLGEEYLVPLLGVWDSARKVDFDSLPEKFVLKANHGSGMNLVVQNKSKLDIRAARKRMQSWLKTNFAWWYMELQYFKIPRCIIAEEYLENTDENLDDYKFWCFNGKVRFIEYVTGKNRRESVLLNLEWETQPITQLGYPRYDRPVPKPDNLEAMKDAAEALAGDLPNVRVDFYRLNDGRVKFGEMTFSDASGLSHFDPPEADLMLGQMLVLPIDKQGM